MPTAGSWLSTVAAALLLGGCTGLLPRSQDTLGTRFDSYESAEAALLATVPYESDIGVVQSLGFDIHATDNVERLPFPQWLSNLVPANLSLEAVDAGVRDCVAAQAGCEAYVFRFSRSRRVRSGGFLADFFNFRRVTDLHGWRFQAVVLVRDRIVLFRNHEGQRRIESREVRRNPLGPLQSIGESAPARLID